ncbi:MAG: universal stress protein [Candidatus Latescibacteria bacterium]|nr:universal stress protein [Candidatus Latescibacterota bacterium]
MYSKILVALDGSEYSLIGGAIALELAKNIGAEVIAAHIFDARLHSVRFREMESTLPSKYQDQNTLKELRDAHNDLIFEGFEALSKGYMEQFLEKARENGVFVSQIQKEGRNYIQLLQIAEDQNINLIVLGAHGLGNLNDGNTGSNMNRVVRLARCDVLIARRNPEKCTTIIGIDGSGEASGALRRAMVWSRTFGTSLHLVSAYDPFFHINVFKTMAYSLSPERQKEVGLIKQESLHEDIIDDGLGKLYREYLDLAYAKCKGMDVECHLLQGKAFRKIIDYGREVAADFIVLGRFGHHRNDISQIGSTSESVARLSQTNVLITGAASNHEQSSNEKTHVTIEWDDDAQARLDRIPHFARPMARQTIENCVLSKGGTKVTLADFQEIAQRFGMGSRKESGNE